MTGRKLVLPDDPHLKRRGDGRLSAPSAERNLAPIRARLEPLLPARGHVLEIASGTGQQIAALAGAHPHITWQPTDIDPVRLASIAAWRAAHKGTNLLPPLQLDAAGDWPQELTGHDLIYAVNLFHLIPKQAARRALAGAKGALKAGGALFIYGPFTENGRYRSRNDAVFDRTLRDHDPQIGYKDRAWMGAELTALGLTTEAIHEMPANNLALVGRL